MVKVSVQGGKSMGSLWQGLMDFWANTTIPEQLADVDWRGVFTNPWFMVPLVTQLGWWIYKQALNAVVITFLALGVWVFTGTSYASGLVIDGNIQLDKVLPVAGVGMGVLMIVIYLFFIRAD
jgi:hypothetical protein